VTVANGLRYYADKNHPFVFQAHGIAPKKVKVALADAYADPWRANLAGFSFGEYSVTATITSGRLALFERSIGIDDLCCRLLITPVLITDSRLVRIAAFQRGTIVAELPLPFRLPGARSLITVERIFEDGWRCCRIEPRAAIGLWYGFPRGRRLMLAI